MPFLKLDDFTVPGYGLVVGITAPLKDEDASGETSSTARAKKGNKGKKLDVRCRIRFIHAGQLAELIRVAEAAENGDSKVYTITNDTANTAGMRQGRFTGNIKAEEAENVRAWDVSFILAEHVSVPEMAEARQERKSANVQTSQGADVGQAGENPAAAGKEEETLTTVEQVLKYLNNAIGPESE